MSRPVFLRVLALTMALLVCLPGTAQTLLDENPANCFEVKDPGVKDTLELCTAHPGCAMVMRVHRACTKVRSFVDRLNQTIGDGVRTLFGTRREVTPDIVFQSTTPVAANAALNSNPAWQTAVSSVGDGVRGANRQTASGGSGDQAWSYQGDVRDGKPNGWGTQFNANGTIVRGQFRDGQPHGQADSISIASDTRQTGSFQNGNLNGRAYEYKRGETYVGSWRDNQRDGYGTLTAADGSRFEGAFRANEINGPGTRYRTDGTVAERGIFAADGRLTSGQRLDAQGRITETLAGNTIYAQAERANQTEQERLRAAEQERLAIEQRRKAELAAQEQKRQERLAAEKRQFESSLDAMNPGQLLARADELRADGKADLARQVLRTMLSKYPDHALAATAAQQLSSASAQASTASPPGSSGTAAAGSGSSVSQCQDMLAAKEKEYERLNKIPLPQGATPGLKRVMWMTQDQIQAIDRLCAGDSKATRYRAELQTAFNQAKTACDQLSIGPCSPDPYDGRVSPEMAEQKRREDAQMAQSQAEARKRAAEQRRTQELLDLANSMQQLSNTLRNRRSGNAGSEGRCIAGPGEGCTAR